MTVRTTMEEKLRAKVPHTIYRKVPESVVFGDSSEDLRENFLEKVPLLIQLKRQNLSICEKSFTSNATDSTNKKIYTEKHKPRWLSNKWQAVISWIRHSTLPKHRCRDEGRKNDAIPT